MKLVKIIFSILILFVICSLSQSQYEGNNRFRKYGVKSGVILMSGLNMMGKSEYKIIFDNYGENEYTEVIMNMMGTEEKSILYKIDSLQYMLIQEIGIKARRKRNFSTENVDVSKIKSGDTKDYKIIYLGEVEYFKKICNKYEINNDRLKLSGYLLEWNNIPLQIVWQANGIKDSVAVKELDLECKISADIFFIPKDIEFQDMTAIDNN